AALEAASTAPSVAVTTVKQAPADAERVLPGNAQPLMEASLYARATGFIKKRLVDIGDRVQEGQLLAVIESPDIDHPPRRGPANRGAARGAVKAKRGQRGLGQNGPGAVREPEQQGLGDRHAGGDRPAPGHGGHDRRERRERPGEHSGLRGGGAALPRPASV